VDGALKLLEALRCRKIWQFTVAGGDAKLKRPPRRKGKSPNRSEKSPGRASGPYAPDAPEPEFEAQSEVLVVDHATRLPAGN
jgi:hypothetical protein